VWTNRVIVFAFVYSNMIDSEPKHVRTRLISALYSSE